MRTRASLAIAATLLVLATAPVSQAAIKSGDRCSTAGKMQTVDKTKFICKKIGSRLQWVKNAPATQPSPTPTASASATPAVSATPTPTPTPTPTQKSFEDRWRETNSGSIAVFTQANFSKMPVTNPVTFIWHLSDNLSPEIQSEFKNQYEFAARFWSMYYTFKIPLHIVVGNSKEMPFLCQWRDTALNMTSPDCVTNLSQLNDEGWLAGTTQNNSKAIDWYLVTDASTLSKLHFLPRIPHEFFHNAQHEQSTDYKKILPCWAEEGGAEFAGTLVYSQGNFQKYIAMRNMTSQTFDGPNHKGAETPAEWKAWLYRADITSVIPNSFAWGCQPMQYEGIYHLGVLANEYLAKELGFAGIITLYQNAAALGWDKGIEKSFNKSKDQVYSDIAQYMYDEYKLIVANSWTYTPLLRNR